MSRLRTTPPTSNFLFRSLSWEVKRHVPVLYFILFFSIIRFWSTLMSSTQDASNLALLSDSIRLLQVQQQSTPWSPYAKDGYGFRKSGISTPAPADPSQPPPTKPDDLVPDPNGLGWPGESSLGRPPPLIHGSNDIRHSEINCLSIKRHGCRKS